MLDPLLDFILPLLEVLDLLEENAGEIINVAGLPGLADFEEFVVGEGQGCELRSELLGPDSQLLVQRLEVLHLLVDLLYCYLHLDYNPTKTNTHSNQYIRRIGPLDHFHH